MHFSPWEGKVEYVLEVDCWQVAMETGRIRWGRKGLRENTRRDSWTREHLGRYVQTYSSKNFLEPVKVILARTPCNGGESLCQPPSVTS